MMNRENKGKLYGKGYYKMHSGNDSFTFKVCGRPVIAAGTGGNHRNHYPNYLSVCIWILNRETEKRTAGGVWVRKNRNEPFIRCRRAY